MNKKQFYRLTIVLTLPFLMLSWWLSQQDFILERGQQITCDVESNYCRSVSSFPVQYFDVISENNGKISYADAANKTRFDGDEGCGQGVLRLL